MTDLEKRARAVVVAGRDADSPSPADRERIKRAVLVQIAAGGVAASTAAAGTLSLGAKAGVAVLAVALVGGGTVGALKLWRPLTHKAPLAVPAQPAARPAPPTAMASASGEPPALAPAMERSRRSDKPRKVAGPAGKSERGVGEDPLAAEVEVLKRAREELRLGQPTAALATLAEYDRRFGRGVLGEERQAIAAIAACQATPGPAARAQAEEFIRRVPTSPLRERVRATCITGRRADPP